MLTNYVYKLRPNRTQSSKMSAWIDMLRSQYNWCLGDRICQYSQQFIQGDYCDIRTKGEASPLTCFVSKSGATGNPWKDSKLNKEGKARNPRRSAGDIQITALPELKMARPWYSGIDSTVLQQNVKRLDIAYKNFFEGRGFPKFKNRSNFTSFTFVMGIKIKGNKIYLPKLGWMRFYNSRSIPDGFTIKACAVRKRQNGWYVSIRIEDKSVPEYSATAVGDSPKVIGCDLGITKLVHLSDGYQIKNPKLSTNKKAKRTLKIRQRRVSRKTKGSKNRKKAAIQVGKFHQKISDKRQAYQWKAANLIVSRNVDVIAIEDLNISGMMRRCKVKSDEKTGRFLKNGQSRKKGLNRAIFDASWGDLGLKIEYLAAKQGKIVIKVNPKHSSQECRNCGHIDQSNRDGEKFICVECGYHEHADIGAAKTIRDRALKMVRGDSAKLGVQHLNAQKISPRRTGKRGEFGNLSNQDIKNEIS
ncbi:MAG: transposase [Microcoleus sp. PH2017_10_PVI_O_A]|uniref:RNA-guided endonuclease InsQ/TnpB family protein n=1 Tax=Microcoleus sp. PH2017_11_PCY_U_A TaxID=2798822 RepID=UPI001D8E0E59|nr:transposase [Microcoleus sp. PH2017_11_PCY_U_A]MCC3407753.1 transposase [Microcoleus sp. PH2017_10_PVI_O_A]MCC3480383.1 transposase [Microcoleus sp. PH2017_12_PCY_D_A]MCC3530077.1 transposase [Microcoleus sp. PH2017_21_RUC_O_A]MCC3542372.1 transposase [Microcoleus sp. PH2017_22_RUC_O_B]MCC3561222.1 transposase [Microcoleus sp. PH2017_27_LUM_O_A]TAE80049.1 MAG: transposase [Oscillatoriales cyanobacterium]